LPLLVEHGYDHAVEIFHRQIGLAIAVKVARCNRCYGVSWAELYWCRQIAMAIAKKDPAIG